MDNKRILFDINNDKFQFVHVPKCGGSSLHLFFDSMLDQKYLHVKSMTEIGLKEKIEKMVGAGGHQVNGGNPICKTNCEGRFFKFISLREPLDRVISMYKHIIARPGHHIHKLEGFNSNFSLTEFSLFCIEKDLDPFNNLMSKFVAGSKSKIDHLSVSDICMIFDKDFDLFCPTEFIDFYYEKLTYFFQKPFKPILKRKNISRKDILINDKDIEKAANLIYEKNYKDLRLYQYAFKKFINNNLL